MTDKITDEDVDLIESQETEDLTAQEDIIDDDPMITEMREAEAEIKALEEQKAELEEEAGEKAPEPETKAETEGKAEAKPEDDSGDNSPMIPKARFDQVLSERDLLRNQVGYMRGLIDAKQPQAGQQPAPQQESKDQTSSEQGTGNQEGSEVDEIDSAIDAAELKKLELAEKYDEGEISTREWKEAELAIDKEIRGLSKQRLDKISEESRQHTDAKLSAQQQADFINDQALAIQHNHPNIATIDNLPKATSDAIWASIDNQAARNLAQQGVNLQDGSVQTRVALMREKAALTDQLTPENTTALLLGQYNFVSPSEYKASNQQSTGQTTEPENSTKQPSEKATNLGKKLDLANSQPPSIADMGQGTDDGELTEEALANMTEDQMADLLEKSPQLVKRVLGNSAI